MRALRIVGVVVVAVVLLVPGSARAQSATTGSIAGVVKDTSGAAMPGVSVEASSPALIEKVRVVSTDEQGNYKIVDLRPGAYTVTFTLSGFSTVKREGIELTTGFTAGVNADMKVGSLEETVTVTGASPVVDIQNSRTQSVLSQEVLDAVPTAKTIASFTALTLGATLSSPGTQDVGGNKGEQVVSMAIHGGRGNDSHLTIDGMSTHNNSGAGGVGRVYFPNLVAVQETTLETSGQSADSETSGIQVNYVPKEGGNAFQYYFSGNISNEDLQGKNLSAEHRQRGLLASPFAKLIYDAGVGLGGPIKRDRVWFYTAHRWLGTQENQVGAYFNGSANRLLYTPDISRPAYTDYYTRDHSVRVTWQATRRHKIAVTESIQRNCQCFYQVSGVRAPEASSMIYFSPHHTQVNWSNPASNRFLLEAGMRNAYQPRRSILAPGVTPDSISITDTGTGITYGAFAGTGGTAYAVDRLKSNQNNGRFATSYITGSHAFKAGLSWYYGWNHNDYTILNALTYTFRSGAPLSLTQFATPILSNLAVLNLGYYAQDQWTMRQLTLNLGLRYDTYNGRVKVADLQAARFVPARHFDEKKNVPNWKDFSPRVGASYDLFGNGKTALKGALGRYVVGEGITGVTDQNDPQKAVVLSATRTWTDANGDFVPNCDLGIPGASGECGALNNNRFGTANVTSNWSKDVLEGVGVRPYNWQASVALQHELRARTALNVGYFRTWYGNFRVTDNLLVAPADYNPFCVTGPANTLLPGGGGQQLCGLYDLNPAKFGQVNTLVTQASHFGKQTEVFDGIDIGVNSRFRSGGLLAGGVATGRVATDRCFVVDSPQEKRFCDVTPPWIAGTQVKLAAVYPLVWGVQASATYQNLPAVPVDANFTFTNAQILPSLGRNLSAGVNGSVTASLYAPQVKFEDQRLSQLDLRFTKIIRVGRAKMQGMFDIYNVTNAGTILGVNPAYGALWRRPTSLLGPRLLKFGGVFDF